MILNHSTWHDISSHHFVSEPHLFFMPSQIQAHFIPSGKRLAQEYLDNFSCMQWATRQATNGPSPTYRGTLGKWEPCVQRELIWRVLVVIVIKNRKREPTERERERKNRESDRQTDSLHISETLSDTQNVEQKWLSKSYIMYKNG